MEKTKAIQPLISDDDDDDEDYKEYKVYNDDTFMCNNLPSQPRLTPTGRISYAKTRVYTQRYRKEWEKMDDFKGWLTSVPLQPTRAYCLFCKKNLHAHRLSLLKHTCTMKHQRAALAHETKEKTKLEFIKKEIGIKEMETADNSRTEEGEENEEEVEYVIERLESDEEYAQLQDTSNVKEVTMELIADGEEEAKEADNELCLQVQLSEDDTKTVIKKIKLPEKKCRDTLAEAMAHVHNDFLEVESEDQENIQMVVMESGNDMEVILSNSVDDETKEMSKELRENSKTSCHSESKVDVKKSTEKILEQNKNDMIVTSLPILETNYEINTTASSTQDMDVSPISNQNKTFTLTSGKTLTLSGGTFQPGTQYVLNKIKGGALPAFVIENKEPIAAVSQSTPKNVQVATMVTPQSSVPSTSQKLVKLPPPKPKGEKKLCISTHVVDITKGTPVNGMQVSLYKLKDGKWTFVNEGLTTADGRCSDLLDSEKIKGKTGRYKIHLDVDKYFTLKMIESMYPFIEIVFDVKKPIGYYHIPVLLSPFGYSTYRG